MIYSFELTFSKIILLQLSTLKTRQKMEILMQTKKIYHF